MSIARKNCRVALPGIPSLPLPAILGFAVVGFGGALFLAYSGFTTTEGPHFAAAQEDQSPVYSARAVPLDASSDEVVRRSLSVAQSIAAIRTESRNIDKDEVDTSSPAPLLASITEGELKGFSKFSNFSGSNTYLALAATTYGMSAQMNFVAPDAEMESMAPVPEASTWLCGVALIALVGARGVHAHWHRSQQRAEKKSKRSTSASIAIRS
ncbi:MAG: hypothetical protein LC627_06370 [Verrucomicrobiaceae bacterium]|nr:hypothetical protein [Verrucomicrobiaceae bacterium]